MSEFKGVGVELDVDFDVEKLDELLIDVYKEAAIAKMTGQSVDYESVAIAGLVVGYLLEVIDPKGTGAKETAIDKLREYGLIL